MHAVYADFNGCFALAFVFSLGAGVAGRTQRVVVAAASALRETGFETLVPAKGVCQGSCIYLLAAGRKKTVRGHVGLHRPHFPAGESAQASRAGMPYNSAGYFRDMGVASSLVVDMQAIEPQRMKVLTPAELKRYRLH